MIQNIEETFSRYERIRQERWEKISISALVFGPKINGRTLGSKLRSYIINKCNQYGVTLRCEHSDFINNHRSTLGANKNLIFAELDAARFVDVIIIIPDSFVELGMLSPCKNIHQKVIILFKDKYENDNNSFVHEGPKLVFAENYATIEYVDYRKKQSTWEKVRAIPLAKKADKYERDILVDLIGQ